MLGPADHQAMSTPGAWGDVPLPKRKRVPAFGLPDALKSPPAPVRRLVGRRMSRAGGGTT
jgi:hypothetical protein